MRLGEPLPDRILNAPVLETGLDFYYDAFFELCTERSIGFDEGPIPVTAILRYAELHELSKEEQSDLVFMIMRMDGFYLEHKRLKQATKTKPK